MIWYQRTPVAVVMSALFGLLREPLLSLYGVTEYGDALARITFETAMTRISYKWPGFVLIAVMNATAGVLRGLGKSISAAAISFVGTCVFRVVWIYTAFRMIGTLDVIYLSYPISWFLTGAVYMIAVLCILRGKIRRQDAHTALQ